MTDVPAPAFDGKAFAAQLSTAPGVYRMYAADDTLLYVGKARALRNRVGSYFNGSPKNARIMSMISQIVRMDVTVTRSEAEALLLENQLIKSLSPRYNVSAARRQDLSACAADPRGLAAHRLHRGPRAIPGRYFGPYPGVTAVRETLNLMQLFKLRSCEDSVFRNRSRPCRACSTRSAAAARPAWSWWRACRVRRIGAPRCIVRKAERRRPASWKSRCTPRGRTDSSRPRARDQILAAQHADPPVRGWPCRRLDVLAVAMQGAGLRAAAGLPRWPQPRHPPVLPAHQW
jgi:hypothetical protein